MKTLFLATIILFGTITVAAKHGVIPQDSIAYYALNNDTLKIILVKKDKWKVILHKRDSLYIQIYKQLKNELIEEGSDYVYENYCKNHRIDTFYIQTSDRKINNRIKKLKKELKILERLYSIYNDMNCEVYLHPAPMKRCSYSIYADKSECIEGVTMACPKYARYTSSPQYYRYRCYNQYEKQFLVIINLFFDLINEPRLLVLTYPKHAPM